MGMRGPKPGSAGARRNAERMRAMHADPDFKAKQSERMRAMHADPDFKAKHRERMSERMRAMNADPDFKARQDPWLASLTAKERADYDLLVPTIGKAEARAAIDRQRHPLRQLVHGGDA